MRDLADIIAANSAVVRELRPDQLIRRTGTFDFGDGRGPVPVHRHPNGGGLVADSAYVAETAYVGPNARVFGYAAVLDHAALCDYARAGDHSVIRDSAFIGGDAWVGGRSVIAGEVKVFGEVRDSIVTGDTQVGPGQTVEGRVICA